MIITDNIVGSKQLQDVVKMRLLASNKNLQVKELLLVKGDKVELQKAADTCILRLFSLLRACKTPESRASILSTLGLDEESITKLVLQ